MKTLYHAANSLEAHMIVDLLQQNGISGKVEGEYLQGGIGELPVSGLIRVVVPESDYDAAKVITDQWDATQPEPDLEDGPADQQKKSRATLVWGMIVGAVFLLAVVCLLSLIPGTEKKDPRAWIDEWNASQRPFSPSPAGGKKTDEQAALVVSDCNAVADFLNRHASRPLDELHTFEKAHCVTGKNKPVLHQTITLKGEKASLANLDFVVTKKNILDQYCRDMPEAKEMLSSMDIDFNYFDKDKAQVANIRIQSEDCSAYRPQ